MEWIVTLSGSTHILEELSKVFDTPDICIQKENSNFVLRSKDFINFTSDDQVRESTDAMLALLNGASKLNLGYHPPITIEHISRIYDDGKRHCHVLLEPEPILVSAVCSVVTVIHSDGTTEELHPADPVVTWVALSKRDTHVKYALCLIENDFETWYGLYKVFEVIRGDIGDIAKKGWCTQGELKRFTQTANSAEAVGLNARHAKHIPVPSDPMSLSSAKSFIRKLVDEWLKEKRIQYGL